FQKLLQTRAVSPGESHRLTCTASGFTFSNYTMVWVRQAPGKGLDGYSDASKTLIPWILKVKAVLFPSANMVYLTLSNLKPEDSAVYYCAR
uniref:Ig-like domain-containing protein n=1 Tax=Lates calcarifer TaxID=8187 RepID=A0A4W6ER60_LATCA